MKGEFNRSILKTITGIFILILILAAYPPILRIVLSLLLVLFLPGYMLTVILFPRNSLGIPERLLLSIGSSMGITAVSGLILHWTTSGLRTTTLWGILLLWIMVEVAVLVIARDQWLSQASRIFERKNFNPREWLSKTNNIFDGRRIEIRQWLSQASSILERNNFSPGEWLSKMNNIFDGRRIEIRQWLSQTSRIFERNNFNLDEWLSKMNNIFDGRKNEMRQRGLLVLSASFIVIAILIARSPAPQQGLEGYTLLWMQPTGAPDTVRIGVTSQEFATTRYQLKVEDSNLILTDPVIELEPGETWEKSLRLGNQDLVDKSLTVSLYRLDSPTEAYRRVVFWPETD